MFPFDDVIMGTILVKNNINAISTQLMKTDNVNRRCRITGADDVTTLRGFLYWLSICDLRSIEPRFNQNFLMHQIFWKSITLKVSYLIAPLNTPLEKEISKTSEMIWYWLHFYPRPVLAFGYYLNTFHVYWSRQSRVFRSLTSLLPIQPPTTRFLIHTNLETFLI